MQDFFTFAPFNIQYGLGKSPKEVTIYADKQKRKTASDR